MEVQREKKTKKQFLKKVRNITKNKIVLILTNALLDPEKIWEDYTLNIKYTRI